MSVLGMSRTDHAKPLLPSRHPAVSHAAEGAAPHRAQPRAASRSTSKRASSAVPASKRCPTDAIIVPKADKEWNIDRLRCCTCNACVEVCPKKCLAMDNRYTPPTVTKDKDIFRQPPRPPKEPETSAGV